MFREEGEIGSKSREEGEIVSESGEKGNLLPCSFPLPNEHCPPTLSRLLQRAVILYHSENYYFNTVICLWGTKILSKTNSKVLLNKSKVVPHCIFRSSHS